MNLAKTFHVVTGASRGIGRAVAVELAKRGALGVALVDRIPCDAAAEAATAAATAEGFKAVPLTADVGAKAEVRAAIAAARTALGGRLDSVVSNAGVVHTPADEAAPFSAIGDSDAVWAESMGVNLMAHVWAAEAVVPDFEAQAGGGALVQVASAAGLLTQVGAPAYSVSKAAAVAYAEAVAVHHGDKGVRVHVVCPQAVATALVGLPSEDLDAADRPAGALAGGAADGVLSVHAVATAACDAMEAGEFLCLPHPTVAGFVEFKAARREKWIAAMQQLRDAIHAGETALVQSR